MSQGRVVKISGPLVIADGMKEADMSLIVNWLDIVLTNADNDSQIATVKGEINEFMSGFELYPDWKVI